MQQFISYMLNGWTILIFMKELSDTTDIESKQKILKESLPWTGLNKLQSSLNKIHS